MADVMQKAITANDFNNGSAVAAVDKLGNIQSLPPDFNPQLDITSVETEYTSRFDDIAYY